MSYQKLAKQKMTCGSCRFLSRDRVYETPCGNIGRILSSKACTLHSPDIFTLVKGVQRVSQVKDLSRMLAGFSANDIAILASVLLRTKHLKRYGHTFFQKVYVRVSGFQRDANYLNQFAVGYIVDADKEYVRIISEKGECSYSLMNDKDSVSYYTVSRFKPMRHDMLANKRFIDPGSTLPYTNKSLRGEIPSLAEIDAIGGVDTTMRGGRKMKRIERDDLTSIVSKMQRGIMRADKKAQKAITDDTYTIMS